MDAGDKIIIQTKDQTKIECRFVGIKENILRAEQKKGPIYEIPLTEVDYIRKTKTNVLGTSGLVLGVGFFIALIAGLITAWMAYN